MPWSSSSPRPVRARYFCRSRSNCVRPGCQRFQVQNLNHISGVRNPAADMRRIVNSFAVLSDIEFEELAADLLGLEEQRHRGVAIDVLAGDLPAEQGEQGRGGGREASAP